MGCGCTKSAENVYFRARKEAARTDARLSSREGAAELLGVSPSTVADYELGNTKVMPVDKVDMMSELYNCPELRTTYCKTECPIGKRMALATEVRSLESIVIRFLKEFDRGRLEDIRSGLIEIAADGKVDASEKPAFQVILSMADDLALILCEMRLAGEKSLKELSVSGKREVHWTGSGKCEKMGLAFSAQG